MFLNCDGGYYADGGQWARGPFLMLFQDPFSKESKPELRALVRCVTLRQLGHWMMGHALINGVEITVSGSYGADGLPMSIDRYCERERKYDELGNPIRKGFTDAEKTRLWGTLAAIPKYLQDAFWAGGGHNSAGAEGPAFRKWAIKSGKKLSVRINDVFEPQPAGGGREA
jgi:hypothetical protein